MKISIIVPFHRGVHFLEDCFASIADQGMKNIETILVLDHVIEDLTELLTEYEETLNIKIIRLEDNSKEIMDINDMEQQFETYSGVAKARNAGLEEANGEYIYFLDSDDYILNGTLPLLLKEAEEQKADITYGRKASTWFKRKVYLASIEEQGIQEDGDDQNQGQGGQEGQVQETQQWNMLEIKKDLEENIDPKLLIQSAEAYYHLFVSRKGLGSVSVLGILYRKSFLMEHELRFYEAFTFYSDLTFLLQVLDKMKISSFVEEAIYVKRKHNDPIHYPSLTQWKAEEKFAEYVASYERARDLMQENTVLIKYLEKKSIDYFTGVFAPHIRRSENDAWRKERFMVMHRIMKEIKEERIKELKGYRKRVIKALLQGSIKKVAFHINANLAIKKLGKIRKNKRIFAYYLYNKHFIKLPIKENWVICESFFGKSYSDSPKYIYEYLSKHYPGKYRFIWVVNNRTKIPYNPTKVKRFSIRYCYYLARSKYNIFNVRQPEWVRKREGNVFLETWHGTPLKKLVFDQEEVMAASPLYKAQFYKQSRIWDYLVSANRFSTEAFRSAFRYDKEILEYGYPRNDILHRVNKEEQMAQLKKKLRIPEGKKTILYAPTWRDDEYYGRGQYKFNLKLDLRLLRKQLGEDYVVLLRTHYFIADSLDVTGLEGFAMNFSKYDDISELYLVSDILITDYSSVFFDYANLKRPILFYTYDLEKYRDMLRGFYLDIEKDVPGPLLFDSQEVVDAIKNIDAIEVEYREKYDEFYEKFCGLEDGHASEKVAKRVFDLE